MTGKNVSRTGKTTTAVALEIAEIIAKGPIIIVDPHGPLAREVMEKFKDQREEES